MYLYLTFLLLFPLAGAIIQLACLPLGGYRPPRRLAEAVACLASFGALAMAVLAFAAGHGGTFHLVLRKWLTLPGFTSEMSLLYDPQAALMGLMVTLVAFLVHLYSVPFMRKEEGWLRYFFLLNLFLFSMLVIVLADDLLFLFLGWEGVGFCSYALIGFWYQEPANCRAGRKAFLVTRIGDAALLTALALLFSRLGTLSLSGINLQVAGLPPHLVELTGYLLLVAAMAKSAQMPLQVWLPDAMAGPTPVSALIHAATMVTAGVYLLIRFLPLLTLAPRVMLTLAAVGAVTALLGAASALAQRDIKRVLAYSTISHVGFMFLGLGAGDMGGALFHLLVHGFFKSLLFLGAGCLIMLLDGEHDIFRMGGKLRRCHPALFWTFAAGIVSLAGVPPASGFFSKGEILAAVFQQSGIGYRFLLVLALAAVLLSSLYGFRLLLIVFFGQPAPGAPQDVKRPPPFLMVAVLYPLALLALTSGLLNLPSSTWLSGYLGSPAPQPGWIMNSLDTLLVLGGLGLAWLSYGPADRLGLRNPLSLGALHGPLLSGFGLDRLYLTCVARPYRVLADLLWRGVDERLVHRGLLAPGYFLSWCGQILRRASTGLLSTGLQGLLLGAAAIFCLLALRWWS